MSNIENMNDDERAVADLQAIIGRLEKMRGKTTDDNLYKLSAQNFIRYAIDDLQKTTTLVTTR